MIRIPMPNADEYAPFYAGYVARLEGGDVRPLLASQALSTARLLAATDEAKGLHRYAPGKWSVKETIGHLADAERIFAYRALRFARADGTALPGFDENAYVPQGRFDARPLAELAAELAAVRAATVTLFEGLPPEALERRGSANHHPVSVRALAAIIAGHEKHHVTLLRERYGLSG